MPLGRYLIFTSSLLAILLFAIDWYVPQSIADPISPEIDHSIMRIHSEQKWPEAVVLDNNVKTAAAAASSVVEQHDQSVLPTNQALAYAPPSPESKAQRKSRRAASRPSKRFTRGKFAARDRTPTERHLASEW